MKRRILYRWFIGMCCFCMLLQQASMINFVSAKVTENHTALLSTDTSNNVTLPRIEIKRTDSENIANGTTTMETGDSEFLWLGFIYRSQSEIVDFEMLSIGNKYYPGTYFHDGSGGYYFLSPSAIQWSLEQTDEIATIKQVGYHAKLTAIQAGETIVKLQFLLQHFVPQSNGEYSIASDTITQSATVSVTIVQGSGTTGGSNQNFPDAIFEETLPGATVESGGTSSNTTPNEPDDTTSPSISIPRIDLATDEGNIITNKTVAQSIGTDKTFLLAVANNLWQAGSITIGNERTEAYFSAEQNGYRVYMQPENVIWQVSGDTGSVSKTSGTGGSFTLAGKQSGTVTLTATVPCGYLVQDGDRWVDQGMVGLASASATIQVAQGAQYHNPFANASEDVEVPFADLDPKAWYTPFVKALAAAGFYVGCDFSTSFDGSAVLGTTSTGTYGIVGSGGSTGSSGSTGSTGSGTTTKKINFNASTAENRANTVVVFYNGHKAIGGSVSSYTKNPFWDVSSSHSYYQPVLWGSAQTIVKGYGQGTFGPANGITREQFCTILLRYADYAGIPLSASKSAKTFTDGGSISSWAKDAVVACQKAGIINGYPDGSFRPQNGITRAEVSKMIYMFFNAIS